MVITERGNLFPVINNSVAFECTILANMVAILMVSQRAKSKCNYIITNVINQCEI